MMTTALLIFLGLSTCATLAIVSAVVLGARRGTAHHKMVVPSESTASVGSLVAFSH